MTRKQAADVLGISLSTLRRRTKAGRYTATKTGQDQFAEVTYTYTGIGLPEREQPDISIDSNYDEGDPQPEPAAAVAPEREPSNVDRKIEQDQAFAQAYRSGEATDSNGNKIDGTNEKFPTLGATSLLGPRRPPEPRKPQSGASHMDLALTGSVGPLDKVLINPQIGDGFTRHGAPLAAGLSQNAYDEMMNAWRRNGGRRSMGEQEMAVRRSKEAIHAAFPKADRI